MSIQKTSKNSSRLIRPKKPFEMIYRVVLEKLKDGNALAIYCHLMGKPDNWEINDQYLMNHFGWGRDKTRNAINTLIVNKLMRRTQEFDEKGRFVGKITELLDGYEFKEFIKYDKNKHKNLEYYQNVHPLTEKPCDGLSGAGKQTATIEDIKAFKEEDKNKERGENEKDVFTLSDFDSGKNQFDFDDEELFISKSSNIEPFFVFEKFRFHLKEKKKKIFTRNDFKKWLIREVEYKFNNSRPN
jgi:hypothetical protein